MKKDTHPKYNKVTIQFPKGDTFETYSALSEDKLFVDVDFRKHPAWTKQGVASANASNAQVSKFNEKFGSFDFSSSKKAPAKAETKSASTEEGDKE
jgi:large subunit ribosomal protein L31